MNKHNKKEYPPMHTVEHILNATMVKRFGCSRSFNAHIERKKSKCDYYIQKEPSASEIKDIEKQVNDVIQQNLPIKCELVHRSDVSSSVDLSKLPADASQLLRIVKVGDYDICACIGSHVNNTSEIGAFRITTYTYDSDSCVLRIRFKLDNRK